MYYSNKTHLKGKGLRTLCGHRVMPGGNTGESMDNFIKMINSGEFPAEYFCSKCIKFTQQSI